MSTEQYTSPDLRERFQVGEMEAVVNPVGAYLEQLNFRGVPLLVPSFTNARGTLRGGVFAMIPYGGEGGAFTDYGLDSKHGYTRLVEFDKVSTPPFDGMRQFRFDADHRFGNYEGFRSFVTYQIGRDQIGNPKLTTTVTFLNGTGHGVPEAPGLHYYFPRIDKKGVVSILPRTRNRLIVKQDFQLASLQRAQIVGPNVDVAQFESNGFLVTMQSEDLPVLVAWSDSDDYGCIEPTRAGVEITKEDIHQKDLILPKGGMRQYLSEVTWQPLPGALPFES